MTCAIFPAKKPLMLSRATALTKQRKTLPSFDTTFRKLTAALGSFDVSKIRYEEVARSAVFSGGADISV